jgi:hypothetical protein
VRRRARLRLASPAIAALVLTACGGGLAPMSDHAAARVHDEVAAVRFAVQARDADGASRALATLRTSVERLRRSGDLTSEKADEILAAATGVQAQLVAITTTTTTTTTTLPPAPPTNPGKGPKPDKGKHGED